MTSNPLSSDFSYKKYSLEQLDNWVNDAVNCEDLTPQDIYDTIVKCVDESVEYHKKYLTKSIELLSLLKGHREVDFGDEGNITLGDTSDWNDFWEENYYPEENKQYTEEELNAMCDAAEEKEKCREYNLREAEYYNKRAELDAHEQQAQEIAKQVKADGYSTFEKKYKTHDQMIAEGWQMTDDGFWIKETDKGIASPIVSVSA
jgi:hypothetical protein